MDVSDKSKDLFDKLREDLDWSDRRLPEIKEELAAHDLVVIPKKDMEVGRGVVACLFWLALLVGGPLIGAGVAENWVTGAGVTGAGVGFVCSALSMAATQHYYDWKKKRK